MNQPACSRLRYAVHGQNVELDCYVPALLEPMQQLLGRFTVGTFASERPAPMRGILRSYEQAEVMRYLSPSARRISADNELAEVYEDGERQDVSQSKSKV